MIFLLKWTVIFSANGSEDFALLPDGLAFVSSVSSCFFFAASSTFSHLISTSSQLIEIDIGNKCGGPKVDEVTCLGGVTCLSI